MKDNKNTKRVPYDNDYPYENDYPYVYMPSVSSVHECTGLIPSNPISAAELESYNDIYGTVVDGEPQEEDKTSKRYY